MVVAHIIMDQDVPYPTTSQQPPSFNSSSEPPDYDDNNTANDGTFQ